jgi:hypothetical protein
LKKEFRLEEHRFEVMDVVSDLEHEYCSIALPDMHNFVWSLPLKKRKVFRANIPRPEEPRR